MNERFSDKGLNIIKAVRLISFGFAFLVALSMLFSLIQFKTLKPPDNPVIINLKEQFDKDPENQDIKEQVRALDLMARKAYFSSRLQVETGSYLMLAGIFIFLFCQIILSGSGKKTPGQAGENQDLFIYPERGRKYLLFSAAFIFSLAIIASFILRKNLPNPSLAVTTNINSNISKSSVLLEPEQSLNIIPAPPEVNTISQSQPAKIVKEAEPERTKDSSILSEKHFSDKITMSTNFPFFRGQGSRGIVEETGFPVEWNGKEGKNIKWKVKIPKPGFNSPVIWGNKIFLSGADKLGTEVYCVDKNDGKIIWNADASDIPRSPATKPETSEDTGLAAPTLATNGNFVCAIFASGTLACFDMAGNRVWAKVLGLPKNHYGHSSSLIIFEDILLVQYDRSDKSALYGFNIATGDLKWETLRDAKISWASPVIAMFNGIPQVILNSDPYVAAYNPITGKEIWRIRSISAEIGPSVAVNDKMVFVANEFAKLIAIKVGSNPEIAWDDNQFLPEVSSPVATNELLFVATSYGAVACYNTATGELFWTHEFDYGFYSSPIINGDAVYLLDIRGVMHIFKLAKVFSLIAESPLDEKTVTTPAFSEKQIFIRSSDNLYCITGK
jgi:outer membrane protein assembly factor BamB